MLSPYIHVYTTCSTQSQCIQANQTTHNLAHPKSVLRFGFRNLHFLLVARGWLASNNYGAAACKVRDLLQVEYRRWIYGTTAIDRLATAIMKSPAIDRCSKIPVRVQPSTGVTNWSVGQLLKSTVVWGLHTYT